MRRSNRQLERYRAGFESLAELVLHDLPQSITDINIQAGEDPIAAREIVVPLVELLSRATNLGISVCLGTLDAGVTRQLMTAGASVYIIKFETADPGAYSQLEAPGNLEERLAHIRWLASEGWSVSSGFIAGLPGQDSAAAIGNLQLASSLPLSGCSVSPFIPGEATPLASSRGCELELALNCMAALRLMRPQWVIPAVSALSISGPENGYRRGIRAGANLCTINLTPGPLRGDYLLYKRGRQIMTEEAVLTAIAAEGLRPASTRLADHYARTASATTVPIGA